MLFGKKSKPKMSKRERDRQKRHEEYLKRKQQDKASQEKEEAKKKKDDNQEDRAGKILGFLLETISVFTPSQSRFDHHRLAKQGTVFGICLTSIVVGLMLSFNGYHKKQEILNAIQSFTTSGLTFSKTGTQVGTGNKPFQTADHKTVYIPLTISDMSKMEPDASKYHIIMLPTKKQTFTYHPTTIQLYSYGSTGKMFLVVHSADRIRNQNVQIIMWTGEDLSQDKYDREADTDTSDEGLAKFKAKYDTLSFTINLGASSITPIPKDHAVYQKVVKKVKDEKTKKVVKKEVTVKKLIPIPENQDLYNDNKLVYIYNRIYGQKKLQSYIKHAHSANRELQINLAKARRDYSALQNAGFKLPKLPAWITSSANNMSNGLPLTLEEMDKLSLLNDPFYPSKTVQDKIEDAYHKHMVAVQNGDDSSSNSDDDDDGQVSSHDKETKFINELQNMIIRNRQGDTLTTGSTNTTSSSSDENSSLRTANSQWSDFQDAVQNIYDEKKEIYYSQILNIYKLQQDFLNDTSSGSESNRLSNTGAITMSKTSGKNKHGKFMLIAGLPKPQK